jgi:SAM-dependent methyltransferase
MHQRVYKEFERIVSQRAVAGSVLEVGAVPSEKSLLCMASLQNAGEKIGINLDGPYEYKDFKILKGNSNCMECFDDASFSMVLCNALLEHDKYFWKTIAEIKRVTKPDGLIVIGTPGYTYLRAEKLKSVLKKIPGVRKLQSGEHLDAFFTATITFEVHNFPGDYYRFSEQTFKEVFFDGMSDVEVSCIMVPPRIIGAGIKR